MISKAISFLKRFFYSYIEFNEIKLHLLQDFVAEECVYGQVAVEALCGLNRGLLSETELKSSYNEGNNRCDT